MKGERGKVLADRQAYTTYMCKQQMQPVCGLKTVGSTRELEGKQSDEMKAEQCLKK